MNNPDDPKEVLAIVKSWLNGRNFKKDVFAEAKRHLGVE
jgi:hypothetical protein